MPDDDGNYAVDIDGAMLVSLRENRQTEEVCIYGSPGYLPVRAEGQGDPYVSLPLPTPGFCARARAEFIVCAASGLTLVSMAWPRVMTDKCILASALCEFARVYLDWSAVLPASGSAA